MENHVTKNIDNSDLDETSLLLNQNYIGLCACEDPDSDTRSNLKFELSSETKEEQEKRESILSALTDSTASLKTFQELAISKHGLVADDLRKSVWPILAEVDPNPDEDIPSLEDLSTHAEYNQVVLDVNRSLKRFPPGIPIEQRLSLQDKLTILILRVINEHPNLRYYQGYHDVAITFLLVTNEAVAYRVMEKLSTNQLRECMEPTLEKTEYRLNYIYGLLEKVDPEIFECFEKAELGTMFALPWYLTWFGHSLNQYKDVGRLYDYFLASPPLMPLYTAASLVIERRDEILATDCDMASIHVLLSQIPDDMDFESILERSTKFYKEYPPDVLEAAVDDRVKRQKEKRKRELEIARRRMRRAGHNNFWTRINYNVIPTYVFKGRYGLLFAAATVLVGFYAYYMKITENRLFGFINT